jgi:hypothetical protein
VLTIEILIGWAIAAAVVALGCHLVACAVWPFTACRRCKGDGKRRSPSGRAWRLCRRCKGSGARVRLGRRAWTKLGIAKDKLVG